ncbi:hypothetical protein B0A69_20345 [Chryseobacterium shigense]|nr:hypothetical protein B0A69_20345 [Chryseobacterium shigense]
MENLQMKVLQIFFYGHPKKKFDFHKFHLKNDDFIFFSIALKINSSYNIESTFIKLLIFLYI